jgi:hypothetical protein
MTFGNAKGDQAWLDGILDKVGTTRTVEAAGENDTAWVTVAFTWNGLRALGRDHASLATFPDECREGMAARAKVLGDAGHNNPRHWAGALPSTELHAIIILFARDVARQDRSTRATARRLSDTQ